jgi:hypothetical protein
MNDAVALSIIVFCMPLLAVALVSWVLHYFVALTSPPIKRAAWTVALAYVVAALFCTFSAPEEYAWAAPLATIPGALIAFWWWRSDFRRAWLDSANDLPEGVELANDDWRAGLILLAGLLGFAVFKVLFRLIERGQL